jgi:hypothetical protein
VILKLKKSLKKFVVLIAVRSAARQDPGPNHSSLQGAMILTWILTPHAAHGGQDDGVFIMESK